MTQLRSVRNVPTLRVLTLLFPNTSVGCHFALPTRPIRHSTAEVTGKVETTHTRIGIKPSRISPRVHELVNHALACGMNSSASLLGGDLRAHYASHKHPDWTVRVYRYRNTEVTAVSGHDEGRNIHVNNFFHRIQHVKWAQFSQRYTPFLEDQTRYFQVVA
ncbi:uncharacterized protein F5891DRAFT_196272 [Suillus fuscotomentosus]|uniref:Uncharacterized protein n=1 Tax=Suillus fuscotomentosus TaxID=1912939 RepID=A0AAD4EBN0_9AGAM|nr:uncharacterized protein F5891DRAFT_196272 [Suillus fuscotomentosus]KAG1901999.1 hypothetical protein F5891DRAFT_196272 [Suillus fuscotomentosus]